MDYLNNIERPLKNRLGDIKDKFLQPFIKLLATLKVHPNFLSVLGVVFLVSACFISESQYWWLFVVLMSCYLLMDGLDGGLARYTSVNHDGGDLMDMIADQMGVILIPAAACYHFGSDPVSAVLFSNGYILFIALIVYSNKLSIPVRRFIRFKYPVYLLYAYCLFRQEDLMSLVFYVLLVYYWIELLFVLRKIYLFHQQRSQ